MTFREKIRLIQRVLEQFFHILQWQDVDDEIVKKIISSFSIEDKDNIRDLASEIFDFEKNI